MTLLGGEDFHGADLAFREAASRCESGSEGRSALLFLASLSLDPRNPEAHPDTAAVMAGRVLLLPDATPEERLRAEALYVSALDRGADPELRPYRSAPGLAVQFEDCDDPAPVPSSFVFPTLRASSPGAFQGLSKGSRALAEKNEAQAREIEELKAELDRIRKLLALPDTGALRKRRRP